MKSMFRGCVLLAALMAAAPGWASESDEETQAVFAHLLKTHADSGVRVNFVIVSAYGGQEQRQELASPAPSSTMPAWCWCRNWWSIRASRA